MKLTNCIILFMAIIFIFLITFVNRHAGPCEIHPMLERLKLHLSLVDEKTKDLEFYPSDESYTEDKKKVYICEKNHKTGEYYSYNMLLAVGLHEIAHAMSETVDASHSGREFNDRHKQYIKKATELGLFDPNEPLVTDYCPK
jgi:hypothetical protein